MREHLRNTSSDISYTRNVLNMVSVVIFGYKHALSYLTEIFEI